MITTEDVKKCAKLSRIRFQEDELGHMAQQLSKIMDVIKILDEIDTEGVKPLTSVLNSNIPTRSDIVNIQNIEEKLFANVPGSTAEFAKEIKCYIVPKVVE